MRLSLCAKITFFYVFCVQDPMRQARDFRMSIMPHKIMNHHARLLIYFYWTGLPMKMLMVCAFKLNTLHQMMMSSSKQSSSKMNMWMLGHDTINFPEDLTRKFRVWPSEVTSAWRSRMYEIIKVSFSMDKVQWRINPQINLIGPCTFTDQPVSN